MKLNLLPTYVSKEGQAKTAMVLAVVIFLVCLVASAGLIVFSTNRLATVRGQVEELRPQAQAVLTFSQQADTIIGEVTGIDRNIKLADAMIAHNDAYINLYEEVKGYLPSFFRLRSISATPITQQSSAVTITGVLQSHQQYADMVLALLRMPDAVNVQRSGFVLADPFVPALNEFDQDGRPILPGEANIPSDPMDRLNTLIARAAATPTGFMNVGGFGTGTVVRDAMPEWSLVSFVVTLNNRDLFAPDARATLRGPAAAAAPGMGPMGPGMGPMGPMGPMGMPGGGPGTGAAPPVGLDAAGGAAMPDDDMPEDEMR